MKKSIVRVIALIAAVTMMGTSMIGCGNKKKVQQDSSLESSESVSGESETGTESSGDTTDTTNPDETTSDAAQPDQSNDQTGIPAVDRSGNSGSTNSSGGNTSFKEPVYDLGGRTIKIAWEREDPTAQTGDKADSIFVNSVKETEKKYNCKFKFVKKSDYQGLYETVVSDYKASAVSYDAYVIRGYDVLPNLANTGAILPMETKYDFVNDPTWQKSQVKNMGWFKGHKYGLVWEPNELGQGLWYNRALLSQAGIPDLWTFVNNNTWNWDTFRRICKQFETKMGDPNGDGTRDNYAFTAEDPWLTFVSTNNAGMVSVDSKGKATLSLNSKNALDALTLIEQMHNVDHSIPNGTELGKITTNPFNAMFTGKVAMFPYHARYGAVLQAQKINDIGWVYLPKGPAASDYVTPSNTMPDMCVFPTKLKDSEKVIAAVQDALSYWNTSKSSSVAIEKKTEWLYTNLKSSIQGNSYKVLKKQALSPMFTWANNYNLEDLQKEVWPKILSSKNVKSTIDSYKSKLQTELNKKYSGNVTG